MNVTFVILKNLSSTNHYLINNHWNFDFSILSLLEKCIRFKNYMWDQDYK